MKILIIGQSVVDRINQDGTVSVKPGGIHYSVAGINGVADSGDDIYLCTTISKKDEYLFKDFYSKVKQDFIEYREIIPTVNLTIYNDKERDERYANMTDNLNVPLNELNKFDGIFVNMISGFDLTLEQLEEIRKRFGELIYFDVHTFSRGLDEDGNRRFRKIHDFSKWAACVDIIQANEEELKTLSKKSGEREIVFELLNSGVKQVIITKSDRGARIYYKHNGELESIYIPAIKIKTVNKVGCGDVFGAVYFYNYIRTRNVNKSLQIANIAAGCTAIYSNIEDLKSLKNDVQQRYS